MNLFRLALRNVGRNRTRSTLTIAAGAVAVLAFVILRTATFSWTAGVRNASRERVSTRHKTSYMLSLPLSYVDVARGVEGVRSATYLNWFGAIDSHDPDDHFASMAVDPESFLSVYTDVLLSPEQRAGWLADPQGVILGDVLAKKLGVRPGDRVALKSDIWSGDWAFNVSAIYRRVPESSDRNQLFLHWSYFNENMPSALRNRVGWIVSVLKDPSRSATVSAGLDAELSSRGVQTLTVSEESARTTRLGGASVLLRAIDTMSVVILLILALLLGNTLATSRRERAFEYAVLRALGFSRFSINFLILAESLQMGAVAIAVGLLAAVPVINIWLSAWTDQHLANLLPHLQVGLEVAVQAVLAGLVLCAVSAVPALLGQSLVPVHQALRQVD